MSAKATSLVAPVATMTEPPSPSPSTHVLSLHRRRSASFWEGDAFVSLVALFIWSVTHERRRSDEEPPLDLTFPAFSCVTGPWVWCW